MVWAASLRRRIPIAGRFCHSLREPRITVQVGFVDTFWRDGSLIDSATALTDSASKVE